MSTYSNINVTLSTNSTSVDFTLMGGSSSVPDATSLVKGKLRLAGDLGGTADSPSVPGLANKQPLDSDLTAIAALTPSNDDILQRKSGSWANRTIAQLKSDLAYSKADIGLGNVDNTSDANKPISTATQTALNGKYDKTGGIVTGDVAITGGLSLDGAMQALGGIDVGGSVIQNLPDPAAPHHPVTLQYFDNALANSLSTYLTTNTTQTIISSGTKTFESGALLDKGNIVHDIRAYGAIDDGTTDCTNSIQDALDAAANGGTVYVPQGIFLVTNLLATNRVHIMGTGAGSVLKAKVGTTGAMIALKTPATTKAVSITDIKLDGSNEADDGVYIDNTGINSDSLHRLNNVHVENVARDGFTLGMAVIETNMLNCFVLNAGRYGYRFMVGATDNRITACTSGATVSHGFYIQGNNNHFTACKAYYAGWNGTTWVDGGHGFMLYPNASEDLHAVWLSGCEAQNNSGDGYHVDSTASSATARNISITGCIADANNEFDTTYVGYALLNVEESIVVGNIARTGNGGQAHNYGLAIFGDMTGTDISHNYFEGSAGATFIDGSATGYNLGASDAELLHKAGTETATGTKIFGAGLAVGQGAALSGSLLGGIDAPFGTIAGNDAVMRIVSFHGKQQYVSKYGPAEWYISDTSGANETNIMSAHYDHVTLNTHQLRGLLAGTQNDHAVNLAQLNAHQTRTYAATVGPTSNANYVTDGTDDHVQIQAAIDAVATAGGGTVLIMAGSYNASTITLKQGVSLKGEGRNSTVITLKNGAGTLIISENFATAAGSGNSYAGINKFRISDMTLTGNSANQTDSAAGDYRGRNALIKIYGWGYELHNVAMRDAKEIALYTEHDNDWNGENFNEYQFGEAFFINLEIKNYGKVGWVNRGPHDSHIVKVNISSYNASGLTADYGYYGQVDGAAHYGSQGLIADNLHVWGDHAQNAIRLYNTNIIQGKVYAEGSVGAAIFIGNGSSKNNFEAVVGYAADGIEIDSCSDNTIKVWTESNISGSVFKVNGSSAGNVLQQITGYGTGAIFTLSSYTGGNNTFNTGRAYGATIISGTPATSDRLDTVSDNFPETNRSVRWELPVGDTKFKITNTGIDAGTLAYQGIKLAQSTQINFSDGSDNYRIYAGTLASDNRLVFTSTASTDSRYWFDSFAGTTGFSIAEAGTEQAYIGTNGSSDFMLETKGTRNLIFRTNAGTERLRIVQSTGLINIPSTSAGLAQYNTTDQTTNFERLIGVWSGNTYSMRVLAGGTGTARSFTIGDNGSFITFGPTATNKFTFAGAGSNTVGGASIATSGALTATSGVQYHFKLEPTINQSSTAGYTGIYLNATHTATGSGVKKLMELFMNSVSVFTVRDNGTNYGVGIGTASPASTGANRTLLHIVDTSSNGSEVKFDSTTVQGRIYNNNTTVGLGTDTAHALTFFTNGGANPRVTIDSTGLVGIGTTAPTHNLTFPSASSGVAWYNTADQTTNYERGRIYWNNNAFSIEAQRAGTGADRDIRLINGATQISVINGSNALQVTRGTTSSTTLFNVTSTLNAGSGTQTPVVINPTYNQTGTAGGTDLLINRTQTAIGSGTHLLADFQVGGTSRASIRNDGRITTTGLVVASRTVTAATTITGADYTIRFNSASPISQALPTTGIATGQIFVLKNINTGVVSFTTNIDGSTSLQLALQWDSATVQFNGTDYDLI